MKTFLKSTLILSLLLLFSAHLMAQDKIYKKNKEVIECKIVEIGLDDVKYTLEETGDVIFSVDQQLITKIVFASGKEMTFHDSFTDPEYYANQRKMALIMGFLGPFANELNFSFEYSLKPGRSIEATLGIIGLGFNVNSDRNAAGADIKFGYKLIKSPDHYLRGMHYAHILKGGYIRPELAFAFYSADIYTYGGNYVGKYERKSVVAGALMLNFGKQWVYGDRFLFDLYFGVGYGFDNLGNTNNSIYESEEPQFHYGFVVGPSSFPIALTGGLRFGYLLK